MTIISSQRYADAEIVAAKLAAEDFVVSLSPEFEIDGRVYQVVIDGHHSLAAAQDAGVEPEYREADVSECDAICLLRDGEIDQFLAVMHFGDDYYNVATGRCVW